MSKVHIEKNTVQETLVIPLYARMLCTKQYPNLFQDTRAADMMAQMDYDFSKLEQKGKGIMYRFGALETAMRQYDLAWEVRDYLKNHPKAAVVNLGCGLDLTGESCDNGSCKIYNLDFPDVIALREQLFPIPFPCGGRNDENADSAVGFSVVMLILGIGLVVYGIYLWYAAVIKDKIDDGLLGFSYCADEKYRGKWLRELYGMSAFSRNRGFSFCSDMGQVFKKRFALTIDRCRVLSITEPVSNKKNMKK